MAKSTTTASRTTRKTPARRTPTKAPTTKAPVAKNIPDEAAVEAEMPKVIKPAAADVVVPSNDGPEMKKRELIDLVVDRAGVKKKDAKPAIEAALAILGETIASGRELNLQPLGKLRINRVEDKDNGRVIVCKLRQSNSTGPDEKEPLAEAAE